MVFNQARFSLKYNRQPKIRRAANAIEDALQAHYMPPQTMPLTDDFDPAVPRIIVQSKGGHSKITFSQISVDLIVKFDNEYATDYEKTKDYIIKRVGLVLDVISGVDIREYLYCGITYNMLLDIGNETPIGYIKDLLGEKLPNDDHRLYEASRRVVTVKDNKYFINQDIGTYRELRGNIGVSPELFVVGKKEDSAEGVILSLDINNRYQHIYDPKINYIQNCSNEVDNIFSIISDNINEWK